MSDDLSKLLLPTQYRKTTAVTLDPLEGKLITANLLGNLHVERTVRVKRAWHRYGSPRQICIEATDDEGIWVTETIRAFAEAYGLSRQEVERAIADFRKIVGPITGNLPQV